uniref:F-box domain-containing protein n=1 Tax=Panagrolaimus sp. ES5 TaxID=591445 RepID=A0AC34F0B7_9BILA
MKLSHIKSSPNFSNKLYQIYPLPSPLIYYILSHASLPTQIKLSQSCKDIHQKLYKLHNYEVDELWMNGSKKSSYRIRDGKVFVYPTRDFLLQLQYPFIIAKTMFLFNVKEEIVEEILAKLDYSKVEKVFLSCSVVEFETLKKILKIQSLKLLSFWSSNIINTGEIDVEEYIEDNFPDVYIHDPD